MDSKKKITVSWSGGKDISLALYSIMQSNEYEVCHLHAIFDKTSRRIGMHGVSEDLIEAQAHSLGLPLVKVYLDSSRSNDLYEALVGQIYQQFAAEGITHVLFGDIFLEDLRIYRESLLSKHGLTGVFPLWQRDSLSNAESLSELGFKAIICAANDPCFHAGLLGHELNEEFLRSLPENIDPSGENGEFHTFVWDGPIFQRPVPCNPGAVIPRIYKFSSIGNSGMEEENETRFYFQELTF